MSKPSSTYFCGNGHLLEDNPDGVLGEYDCIDYGEYPHCIHCQSTEVVSVLDWHEGNSVIPRLPVRQEDIKKMDHRGNIFFRLINVYDVSKKIRPDIKAVLSELVHCLYSKTHCINPHDNTVFFECIIPNDLLNQAKVIIGWDKPQAGCGSDDK